VGNLIRQTIEDEVMMIDRIISSIWNHKAVSGKLRKQFKLFENDKKSDQIVQAVLKAFRTDPAEGLLDDDENNEE
jgi:hypothetical protein